MEKKISKKILREFGFLLGCGFPLIIGLLIPLILGHGFRFWTSWLGIIFLFLAIFKPNFLKRPYKIWMKFGHILGWLNSRLILGVIYIIVLMPIAFFMRMFGYDPLKRKNLHPKSYREITKYNKIDLNRIF